MTTTSRGAAAPPLAAPRDRLYDTVIGLTALAILLQGLWAGLFLQHDGQRETGSWLGVHARGGEVALVLAAVATVVAFLRLRPRRELWIGSAVLTVLLALEAYLGGLVVDNGKDALTAVHVPLALLLVGLVGWLAVGAPRPRRSLPATSPDEA